jgi:hypothetical protein
VEEKVYGETSPDFPRGLHNAPTRESARTVLTRMIEYQRRKLAGLEALLKVAERAEPGSALEETLCELCCRHAW